LRHLRLLACPTRQPDRYNPLVSVSPPMHHPIECFTSSGAHTWYPSLSDKIVVPSIIGTRESTLKWTTQLIKLLHPHNRPTLPQPHGPRHPTSHCHVHSHNALYKSHVAADLSTIVVLLKDLPLRLCRCATTLVVRATPHPGM
jgi:hypothetical protein